MLTVTKNGKQTLYAQGYTVGGVLVNHGIFNGASPPDASPPDQQSPAGTSTSAGTSGPRRGHFALGTLRADGDQSFPRVFQNEKQASLQQYQYENWQTKMPFKDDWSSSSGGYTGFWSSQGQMHGVGFRQTGSKITWSGVAVSGFKTGEGIAANPGSKPGVEAEYCGWKEGKRSGLGLVEVFGAKGQSSIELDLWNKDYSIEKVEWNSAADKTWSWGVKGPIAGHAVCKLVIQDSVTHFSESGNISETNPAVLSQTNGRSPPASILHLLSLPLVPEQIWQSCPVGSTNLLTVEGEGGHSVPSPRIISFSSSSPRHSGNHPGPGAVGSKMRKWMDAPSIYPPMS